jgi:hypothetical protein
MYVQLQEAGQVDQVDFIPIYFSYDRLDPHCQSIRETARDFDKAEWSFDPVPHFTIHDWEIINKFEAVHLEVFDDCLQDIIRSNLRAEKQKQIRDEIKRFNNYHLRFRKTIPMRIG